MGRGGGSLGAVNTVGVGSVSLSDSSSFFFLFFYEKVCPMSQVRSWGLGGDVGAEMGLDMEEAASSSRAVERWHPVALPCTEFAVFSCPPAPEPGTVLRGPISWTWTHGSGKPVLTVTG